MAEFFMILYTLVAAIGIPANLFAIVILCQGKCDLSKCITCYLVSMSAADLMVVIIEVLMYQMIVEYDTYWFNHQSSLYNLVLVLRKAPFCLVHYTFCKVVLDCSVWLTVAFTFDRFVVICWAKMNTKYCKPKIAGLIIGTICITFCLKNIPFYFRYLHISYNYSGYWECNAKPLLPIYGEFEGLYWVDVLLNPLLPFFLMLTLNSLTVNRILAASRRRRALKGQRNDSKQRDTEMETRRQSIILLFTMSASFFLCWATTTLVFILGRCLYTDLETSIRLFYAQEVGYAVQLLSCCANTFIYGVTQSKFRQQLKIAISFPVTTLVKMLRYCASKG